MDILECFNFIKNIALENNNIVSNNELLNFYDENSSEYKELYELLSKDDIIVISNDDELDIENDLASIENESKYNNQSYSKDLTRIYLNEIGNIKLLSKDEEIELSNLIKSGKESQIKLDSLNDFSIDKIEYDNLNKNIENGELAKNKLIEANLRLVMNIASKYVGRGLSLSDLNQSGAMGLMTAADKFDSDLGYRFSTYATWWIRQGILKAIIDQGRTIRIPHYIKTLLNKYKRIVNELTIKYQREPQISEIANEMGISNNEVINLIEIIRRPESLDKEIGSEKEQTLGDMISSDIKTPLEYTFKLKLNSTINKALETELTYREAYILKFKFGLIDGKEHTYDAIGNDMGVSGERIRQVAERALFKLKNSKYINEFEELRKVI